MSSDKAPTVNMSVINPTPAEQLGADRPQVFSIAAFDFFQKIADRFQIKTVLYIALGIHFVIYICLAVTAMPTLFPSFPNAIFNDTIPKEDLFYYHYATDQPWYFVLQIPVSLVTLIITKVKLRNNLKLRIIMTMAGVQIILGALGTASFIFINNDRIVSSRKCAMACMLWTSPQAEYCPYTVNDTTTSAFGVVSKDTACNSISDDGGLEPANCLLSFSQYIDNCMRLSYQDYAIYRVATYSTVEVITIHPVFTLIIELWVAISAANNAKME